jgi:hypothetical protein
MTRGHTREEILTEPQQPVREEQRKASREMMNHTIMRSKYKYRREPQKSYTPTGCGNISKHFMCTMTRK